MRQKLENWRPNLVALLLKDETDKEKIVVYINELFSLIGEEIDEVLEKIEQEEIRMYNTVKPWEIATKRDIYYQSQFMLGAARKKIKALIKNI